MKNTRLSHLQNKNDPGTTVPHCMCHWACEASGGHHCQTVDARMLELIEITPQYLLLGAHPDRSPVQRSCWNQNLMENLFRPILDPR